MLEISNTEYHFLKGSSWLSTANEKGSEYKLISPVSQDTLQPVVLFLQDKQDAQPQRKNNEIPEFSPFETPTAEIDAIVNEGIYKINERMFYKFLSNKDIQ